MRTTQPSCGMPLQSWRTKWHALMTWGSSAGVGEVSVFHGFSKIIHNHKPCFLSLYHMTQQKKTHTQQLTFTRQEIGRSSKTSACGRLSVEILNRTFTTDTQGRFVNSLWLEFMNMCHANTVVHSCLIYSSEVVSVERTCKQVIEGWRRYKSQTVIWALSGWRTRKRWVCLNVSAFEVSSCDFYDN